MEEMHYFKESQRGEIPVPDFKDNITRKLLLQFLCDLCTWAQATPVTSVGIKKDAHSLYILFRNFTFSEQFLADIWRVSDCPSDQNGKSVSLAQNFLHRKR